MSLLAELQRRNVLRVAATYVVSAWLVIQVAETLFPLFGFDDTPARIVVIVLAIGFFPALILAWAFELTPEGLKKESEVDRSQSITPQTGKHLDRSIMVMLTLALGYFAVDKFVLAPQREAALQKQVAGQLDDARQQGRTEALVQSYGDQSIAVMAFEDMSQDQDQDYLSDGIAEELLNLLAKIPQLRVISRSSAFSFKGQNLELTEIAKRLNVAHILEGSVRKAGNRVRITVQLIEARSDTQLWSETYDRTLDDIFAIQDEISATVVDQLKLTLLGEAPHVETVNPEAYSLFLQARHLGRQLTAEGLEQSNELYLQALAIEPAYAASWAGIASNYSNQANNGLLSPGEGKTQVRVAAERALAINPNYAPAYVSLAWAAIDENLGLAARYYERALQLDPVDSEIIRSAAALLQFLGRLDEAITLGEYAAIRDPVNPIGYGNLGVYYSSDGQWDAAIAALQTALRLSPEYIGVHFLIGSALLFQGDAEAALVQIDQESFEVYRLIGRPMALHALGQSSASDAALAELIEKYAADAAYNIACVLAYRNEADRAFEWLDKAVEYADPGLAEIVATPEFGKLRGDPRWLPFLQSIGRAPEQLAAIKFKVTLRSDRQ